MGLSCLACELTRARLKAAALALVGWPLDRIAGHLSVCYGERYYVEGGKLYRESVPRNVCVGKRSSASALLQLAKKA